MEPLRCEEVCEESDDATLHHADTQHRTVASSPIATSEFSQKVRSRQMIATPLVIGPGGNERFAPGPDQSGEAAWAACSGRAGPARLSSR